MAKAATGLAVGGRDVLLKVRLFDTFATDTSVSIAISQDFVDIHRDLTCISGSLVAHDAIPVRIPHVPVRQVRTRDRGDAVPTGFLAGDPPVSIIVVTRECIITSGGTGSGRTR